jgi:BirA family biotin operon repressor/biotin-[acetyl-CoA-carboxylase] ligase
MFIPLCIFNKIDSTNKEAKKIIQNNNNLSNFAIFAHEQTAGVGKMGASWHSNLGNIHLSIVLKFNNLNSLGLVSISAALAIKNSLLPHLKTNNSVHLKWPNDVLINEAKISGCLIEIEQDYLIIGIGVNITNSPILDKYKTIFLNSVAKNNVDAVSLSHNIIKELFILLNQLDDSQSIINDYLKYSYSLNKKLQINTSKGQINGVFLGISSKGFLQIKTQNDIIEISSGEIS